MAATNSQYHVWAFAPLAALSGIQFWGVSGLLIPYLLRRFGVTVDRIATIAMIVAIPYFCACLCSPLIDLRLRRRTWILAGAIGAALCSAGAIVQCSASLTWAIILLGTGNGFGSFVLSATGALMTEISPAMRGRASGWFQIGNIGLGPFVGGMLIWLSERVPLPVLSGLVGTLLFLLPMAVFWMSEDDPLRRIIDSTSAFSVMWRDVRKILRSKRTWIGLAFLCSPVGTGALNSLISSIGADYHATGTQIAWVTGLSGSVMLGLDV